MTTDTFNFLRNKQGIHDIGLTQFKFSYFEPCFDPKIYNNEVSEIFESSTDAYMHWVTNGRGLGLKYSKKSVSSQLKIVLKAKDETDLIDYWINHHASIVGRENLVILDCQSTSQDYLDKLNTYSKDILVLRYRKYYDSIHTTRSNKQFYEFLGGEAKHIVVLDADEFLVGKKDKAISGQYVLPTLEHFTGKVLPATWLDAVLHIEPEVSNVNDSKISLDLKFGRIKNNTVAGKSVVASVALFDVEHIGHNLHVKQVKENIDANDFFKLFVIHCKTDSLVQNSERALRHLRSRKTITDDADVTEDSLKRITNDTSVSPTSRHYASVALKMFREEKVASSKHFRKTSFLGYNSVEVPELCEKLESFDIQQLPL